MTRPHGDLELALAPALETATGHRAVTDLPDDLTDELPLYQVGKTNGLSLAAGFDFAEVDIETYGGDRAEAVAAAEVARNYMAHQLVGALTSTMTVTRVRCSRTPTIVLYENPNLRRAVATYGLWIKYTL